MLKKNALFKSVTFVLIMIPLLASAISSIQAQDETVTGSMVVDCSTLSGDALQYAQDNDVCPRFGGVRGSSTGTSYGNCGSASLTVRGVPDGINTEMNVMLVSTRGTITSAVYSVSWYNANNQRANIVPGVTWNHSSNVYRSFNLVNTGNGFVSAELAGSIIVGYVMRCTIIPTSASDVVG